MKPKLPVLVPEQKRLSRTFFVQNEPQFLVPGGAAEAWRSQESPIIWETSYVKLYDGMQEIYLQQQTSIYQQDYLRSFSDLCEEIGGRGQGRSLDVIL